MSFSPVFDAAVAWRRYLSAVSLLVEIQRRSTDQVAPFNEWRSGVLELLGSEEAGDEIVRALTDLLNRSDTAPSAQLMVQELEAFAVYVERISGTTIPSREWPPLPLPDPKEVGRGLDIGKTIAES